MFLKHTNQKSTQISTQFTSLENLRSEECKMMVSRVKEADIEGIDELKNQVSKFNPLKVPTEKYPKRERKVYIMKILLETLEHVNVTLPFVYFLEHNPVY